MLFIFGRNNWIRTSGLIVPNDALYQAELYSVTGGNSGRPSHRFAEILRLTLGHCLYSRRIISYFHIYKIWGGGPDSNRR